MISLSVRKNLGLAYVQLSGLIRTYQNYPPTLVFDLRRMNTQMEVQMRRFVMALSVTLVALFVVSAATTANAQEENQKRKHMFLMIDSAG